MTGKEILEAAKERLRNIAIEKMGEWDIQASEAFIAEQIDQAVLEEREECAKLAEAVQIQIPMVISVSTDYFETSQEGLKTYIAKLIRARSPKLNPPDSEQKESDTE